MGYNSKIHSIDCALLTPAGPTETENILSPQICDQLIHQAYCELLPVTIRGLTQISYCL